MLQRANPILDEAVTGWSPTSVSAVIGELNADISTFVSTPGSPQVSTFRVKLAGVSFPKPGIKEVLAFVRKTGSDSVPVIVTLLQGDASVIASRNYTNLGASFDELMPRFILSAAEEALITNYADLHLRVTAVSGTIDTGCCSGMTAILRARCVGCLPCSGTFDVYLCYDPYMTIAGGTTVPGWHGTASSDAGCLEGLELKQYCPAGGFNCNSLKLEVNFPNNCSASQTVGPTFCTCSPFNFTSFVFIAINSCGCSTTSGITFDIHPVP